MSAGFRNAAIVALAAVLCVAAPWARSQEVNRPSAGAPIPSLYEDSAVFTTAIAAEGHTDGFEQPVTGLILPHHLLAADLIARGVQAASRHAYRRVIVMAPDHFNRSRRPFATTTRDVATVFGTLGTDRAAVATLLRVPDLFEESGLFDREHGVAALLPFIKRLLPGATIVPIANAITATRADWDRAFDLLQPLLGPDTLVIQSTDFSHYLRPEIARQRDQESLNLLAAGDPEAASGLIQPDHIDSTAAFYLQLRLQASLGSHPVVIANRNSDTYSPGADRTTSYIVAAFTREPAKVPAFPDQTIAYVGGDFFAGRLLTAPLASAAQREAVVRQVLAVTGGAPLILNLEGAILDEIPSNVPSDLHAMDATLALPLLRALHASAAGLANNHSFDLGAPGLASSERALAGAGIKPLPQGRIADFGPFRMVTLNYVGQGGGRKGYPVVRSGDIESLCRSAAKPPLLAFVHWGREFTATAEAPERSEAEALATCGVSAVIGAHSHTASTRIDAPDGGQLMSVYSLGNFLFDQRSPRGTGALLELRFFKQGTFASRLIPLPNFFEQVADSRNR